MDHKIIWTDPAIDELDKIVRRIARDNPTAAHKLGSELIERVEPAAHFPGIGPVYKPAATLGIHFLSYGNYRIFYRVNPTNRTIEVLSVRHGAMREPELR